MAADIQPDSLADEVLKGKNFHGIDRTLVLQLAERECRLSDNRKEIIKNVKSKLHQVSAVYRGDRKRPAALMAVVVGLSELDDPQTLKEACRELLQEHVSAQERLPFLEDFYGEIFSRLPRIDSVLDLACGFNPFAIPWMPLEENFVYEAYDVYEDMIRLINAFFSARRIQGSAKQVNLIETFPESPAELTFLLKTVPCLEQLDKNAGRQILARIGSPFAVVSFPARSISGRSKGMPKNYEAHFLDICDPAVWNIQKLPFSYELVFLLERK